MFGLTKSKKGSLANAPKSIMALVILGIIGAVGLLVIGGVQDSLTASSAEYNATADAITAVSNFFDLTPVLGTILVAGLLIAAVVGYVKWKGSNM